MSALVGERVAMFPASGEINRKVKDPCAAIARVKGIFRNEVVSIDYTDGLSMEFPEWRFNLRYSNTERKKY